MPLKLEVESLEGIDESVQPLYKPVGEGEKPEKYQLDVEGLPDTKGLKSALEKERKAAKEVSKKLKEYEGVDLERYNDLLSREAQLADADPEKIDQLVQDRIKKNDEAWQGKYKELEKQLESNNSRLSDLLISDELRRVGAEMGVEEGEPMNDFLNRGKGVFRLVDGKVQPVDSEGNIIYGESGIEPLTMPEFAKTLRETAKHLFKSSSGGGASTTGSSGAGSGTVQAKSDLKNNREKAQFIGKHGRKAYLELPDTRES